MRPTITIGGSEPEERDLRATHRLHDAGPLMLTSPRIVCKPNTLNLGVRSQVVDVPVGAYALFVPSQLHHWAIARVFQSAKLGVRQDREQLMLSHDELEKIREEQEALETWRTFSRHVIAHLLEMCIICGTIREKAHLARCRWCEDTYFCKEGICAQLHQAELHPAVAFWTW